jgi:hypothetical protein
LYSGGFPYNVFALIKLKVFNTWFNTSQAFRVDVSTQYKSDQRCTVKVFTSVFAHCGK